jgi:hypothetical protein
MSKQEFDLNKGLLKEISTNKDDLRHTIEMNQPGSAMGSKSPVYAVYDLTGST